MKAYSLSYLLIFQIFQDGELTHYVDGAGDQTNWMKYVNCARHEAEQNLVLIQEDGELFYEVSKDIAEGSELLVWYGDSYLKYMGIPITMKTKMIKMDNEGGIGTELGLYFIIQVTFKGSLNEVFQPVTSLLGKWLSLTLWTLQRIPDLVIRKKKRKQLQFSISFFPSQKLISRKA